VGVQRLVDWYCLYVLRSPRHQATAV
jgi:hypothetical protein